MNYLAGTPVTTKKSTLHFLYLSFVIGALSYSSVLASETESLKPQRDLRKLRVALNWVAEPEFGGFYLALNEGLYKDQGLDVELIQGGAGAPTVPMVAGQKVDIAIASLAEVLMARERDAKIFATFSVYHTSPLVLMAHRSRGFKSLADIFQSDSTLSIEKGQAFSYFLEKKYGFSRLKVVPYTGGVGAFLAQPKLVQQGFIFSEPIVATNQGATVDTFPVADSGYNPYIEVLVFHEETFTNDQGLVEAFVKASKEGWKRYLKDPVATNTNMAKLNRSMPLDVFHKGAEAQKPFIVRGPLTKENLDAIGLIEKARVSELEHQLREIKTLKGKSSLDRAFKNL